MRKTIYIIIGIIILTSCGENENYMTDTGFIEIAREYSPNEKKLILEYHYDVGALGFSTKQISILNENQLSDNLAEFNLPRMYRKANWIDNNSIQAEIDLIPFLREGKSIT